MEDDLGDALPSYAYTETLDAVMIIISADNLSKQKIVKIAENLN